MANTTHTVNPGGGADYTSLSAYEDAIDGTAYSAGETATVNCAGSTADTTAVTFAGWDADVTIIITGDYVCPATGNMYSTSYYHLEVATDQSECLELTNTSNKVEINKLQIYTTTSGNYNYCILNSGTTEVVEIYNCILKAQKYANAAYAGDMAAGGVLKFWNNVCISAALSFSNYGNNYDALIYNNTVYNCSGTGFYFKGEPDGCRIYNNLVVGCGTDYELNLYSGYSHDNNISSDDTGPDAAHISKTITFVDAANGNFHLASTETDAIDLGTSDPGSGLFSDDIDGVTRTGTWDIGADEYVAGGGAVDAPITTTPLNLTLALSVPGISSSLVTTSQALAFTRPVPLCAHGVNTTAPLALVFSQSSAIPGISVSTSPLALSFTLKEPAIPTTANPLLSALSISLTLATPTINAQNVISLTTTSLNLPCEIVIPTVAAQKTIALTTTPLTLAFALPAPTISAQLTISLATSSQTLTLAQATPTVAPQVSISPTTTPLALAFTQVAPTVATTQIAAPLLSAIALIFTQPPCSLGGSPNIGTLAQTLALTLATPTIGAQVTKNITTTPLALTFALATPTLAAQISKSLATSAQALSLVLLNPATGGSPSLATTPQALALTLVTPTVSTQKVVSLTTTSLALVLTQKTPTVSAVSISATSTTKQDLTLSLQTPNVLANVLVTAAPHPSTVSLGLSLVNETTLIGTNFNSLTLAFALLPVTVAAGVWSVVATTSQSLLLSLLNPDIQDLRIRQWLPILKRQRTFKYGQGVSIQLIKRNRTVTYETKDAYIEANPDVKIIVKVRSKNRLEIQKNEVVWKG